MASPKFESLTTEDKATFHAVSFYLSPSILEQAYTCLQNSEGVVAALREKYPDLPATFQPRATGVEKDMGFHGILYKFQVRMQLFHPCTNTLTMYKVPLPNGENVTVAWNDNLLGNKSVTMIM